MNRHEPATLAALTTRWRTRRMSRRAAVSLMTGIGLTAGGAVILPPSAFARQEGGTPVAPPATPALGEQADGTMTWRVQAGHMDMADLIEAMAFFPGEITINAGDRIFFDIHGFHTITFPGDQPAPAVLVPEGDLMGTPAAAGDATRYVVNPMAGFPSGPLVHDGTSYLNTGLPDPTLGPVVIEFTTPGTFDYLCLVHPATMKGTVVVQEQGAERPQDQAAYDQQAMEQMEAIIAQGRELVEAHSGMATPAASGATTWDVAAGVGQDEAQVLRFLPDRLEISAGDTVRWTNLGVTEPHTVTFVGDTAPPELILIEPQADGPPMLVLNADVMAPTGGPSYTPGSYANSGWLQEDSVEFPEGTTFPMEWELTFEEPGEYPYYCVLHAFASEDGMGMTGMLGTIVVS